MATTKTTPRGRARSARADGDSPEGGEEMVNGQDAEQPSGESKPASAPNTGSELLNISDLKDMSACIELARGSNRKRIILESNTKQVAAIKLYRKFGFKETPLDPNSQYVRANIRMELLVA